MGLVDEIPLGARVAFDTSPLIYFMERNARFGPVVRPVFQLVDQGSLTAVCSTMSLLEVLVAPLRAKDPQLVQSYRELLLGTRSLVLLPLTAPLAELAATLRADHKLTVADAVVAATALASGCYALISNDTAFGRVSGLRALVLSEFAESEPPV